MEKRFILKCLVLAQALLLPPCALFAQDSGGVERYAIFVGSNEGGEHNQKLMYAGTDAMAFQKTMSEIGGIPKSNAILLLDPAKQDVDNAMEQISEKIRQNKANTKRSEFLFYYSGHSDENALLLGKASYNYSGLKAAISSVPSDVHVVILDSCYSGNFIRTKGGKKKKPFLVDDSSVVKGHAYLSSSSSKEFSQESDEIGSSFFTNAMLTGLRGAADSSGDKKVTLNELYSYAFSETLSKTENSSAGPQHPNYNITLVGSGDLVLSDISSSDSVVMLSPDLRGRVILRDKNGKLISEINKVTDKPLFLALEKGEYEATLIGKKSTLQGSFRLSSGRTYELSPSSLKPVILAMNRVRGENGEEQAAEESIESEGTDGTEEQDTSITQPFEADSDKEEIFYKPVELSFISNELSFPKNEQLYTNISLAVLSSTVFQTNGVMASFCNNHATNMYGVQGSLIFNEAQTLHGVQGAYIFNKAQNVQGIQGAGIFNKTDGLLKGVQGAGIFNSSAQIQGIQAAGIYNRTENITGLQAAGIYNKSTGLTKGVQVAGIINKAGETQGLQAAGIVNTAKKVDNAQISFICNFAEELSENAVQIGFINIAKESSGFQLGLINISKKSLFEAGVSYTSNNNIRIIVNSGCKPIYIVFGCIRPVKQKDKDDGELSSMVFGLGTRLEAGKFNFDLEAIANEVLWVSDKDEKTETEKKKGNHIEIESDKNIDASFFPSVRASVGYTPIKHLRLFAGAMLSFEFKGNEEPFEHLKKNLKIKSHRCNIYPEFDVGARFTLN